MAPSFKSETMNLNISIPLIVASGVTLLILSQYIFSVARQYSRLSHIPGPFGSGWSRLFIIRSTAKNTLHLDFAAAIKKYGRLVRIAPNTLLTDDPDLIRRMNAVRSPYRKSTWYEMTDFAPDRHHIFSETNEERHAQLRTQMAQGYSGKELGNSYLEECIDNRLLDLFDLIKSKYTSSKNVLKPIDFGRVSQYFVIDVITDMAFRKPFGFLKADADVYGYITTQEMLLPVFEWLSAIPTLSKIAKNRWIAPYVMPKPTDKEGLGYMMGIAKKTVEERFSVNKVVQNDMLGSFIKHGIDQKQAELEAALQVIVGTDTTVTSLRTVVMYVITHPNVYVKLQAELENATLSSPIVTDNEARELPYLQACIKEGMRVFPPVTGLFNKRVPKGGDMIHGKFIPGGTDIAYSAWDFYKDTNIFGADAEIFRPERWLEASEEQLAIMQKTIDLIFGYGKYSCLGKPIALLELGKALAEIFRRYDIELIDPFKPWKCYNRNGFFFQSEMWVRMSERKK